MAALFVILPTVIENFSPHASSPAFEIVRPLPFFKLNHPDRCLGDKYPFKVLDWLSGKPFSHDAVINEINNSNLPLGLESFYEPFMTKRVQNIYSARYTCPQQD